MKKIFAILAATLMLVSMLPLIIAEEDAVEVPDLEQLQEECVERLKGQYPDVDEARLEERCAQMRAVPTTIAATIGAEEMDKLRTEYQEKLAEMNQERREKLAEIQHEYLRKLAEMNQERLEKVADLTEEDIEKLSKMDRARLHEYADKDPAELREALRKVTITKVKKEEAFRERFVAKNKMDLAEENYQKAVRNYNQAKRMFQERKQAWEDAVENGNETAAIDHAKAYLTNAADMVIESLEKVRARIEGNDDLTEEEAEEALVDIDEKIDVLEALKTELDAAETKEEVKEAGAKILAAWARTKYKLKVHAESIVRTQVGEILSRSEALEQHLERVLTQMEEDGIEVDDLDDKIDAFSELVDSARDKFKESRELFEEAKENDDKDALDKSKSLAREAHDELKDAHNILMEIVQEVKSEGYDVEDDEEYVEIVEIEDDDVDEDESEEEDEEEDESEDEEEENDDDEDDESEDA